MNEIVDNETGEVVEANDAHSRHTRIKSLRHQAEQTFLDLGRELYYFEDGKQYLELDYDTFEAYLASPDVDIERRTAFMLKGVYKTFVMELGVQPVALLPAGYSKLDVIRNRVTPENVEGLLHDARELSRSDLIEKMGASKTSKVSTTNYKAVPNGTRPTPLPPTPNPDIPTEDDLLGATSEEVSAKIFEAMWEEDATDRILTYDVHGTSHKAIKGFVDNLVEALDGEDCQLTVYVQVKRKGE